MSDESGEDAEVGEGAAGSFISNATLLHDAAAIQDWPANAEKAFVMLATMGVDIAAVSRRALSALSLARRVLARRTAAEFPSLDRRPNLGTAPAARARVVVRRPPRRGERHSLACTSRGR